MVVESTMIPRNLMICTGTNMDFSMLIINPKLSRIDFKIMMSFLAPSKVLFIMSISSRLTIIRMPIFLRNPVTGLSILVKMRGVDVSPNGSQVNW